MDVTVCFKRKLSRYIEATKYGRSVDASVLQQFTQIIQLPITDFPIREVFIPWQTKWPLRLWILQIGIVTGHRKVKK
jgi:hypothetical protein